MIIRTEDSIWKVSIESGLHSHEDTGLGMSRVEISDISNLKFLSQNVLGISHFHQMRLAVVSMQCFVNKRNKKSIKPNKIKRKSKEIQSNPDLYIGKQNLPQEKYLLRNWMFVGSALERPFNICKRTVPGPIFYVIMNGPNHRGLNFV